MSQGTKPISLDPQPARRQDFAELKGLMNKANEYSFKRAGHYQWTSIKYSYSTLREQVDDGEFFVIRNHAGVITSAIALADNNVCWKQAGIGGPALYFTKFMKDPTKASPGEGRRLLSFAAGEALRRHKSLLRCDTTIETDGLIKYYTGLGFKKVSDFIYEASGRPGVLLEIPAADLLVKIDTTSD